MNVLVNYANERFRERQINNTQTGKRIGKFDEIFEFKPATQGEFFEKHKAILTQPRGNGYWLWKPFCILKVLNLVNYGDIVFYCDSGSSFISNAKPLLDLCEQYDRVLFDMAIPMNQYTKRDCFYYMNCDSEKYWYGNSLTASFQIYKKTDENIKWVAEYFQHCSDYRKLTDAPNECGLPNFHVFKDHRHDQAIVSLMTLRDDVKRFRDPSQYGNYCVDKFEDKYPQIINHYRI